MFPLPENQDAAHVDALVQTLTAKTLLPFPEDAEASEYPRRKVRGVSPSTDLHSSLLRLFVHHRFLLQQVCGHRLD